MEFPILVRQHIYIESGPGYKNLYMFIRGREARGSCHTWIDCYKFLKQGEVETHILDKVNL